MIWLSLTSQSQRLKAKLLYYFAGMRWIMHYHVYYLSYFEITFNYEMREIR